MLYHPTLKLLWRKRIDDLFAWVLVAVVVVTMLLVMFLTFALALMTRIEVYKCGPTVYC